MIVARLGARLSVAAGLAVLVGLVSTAPVPMRADAPAWVWSGAVTTTSAIVKGVHSGRGPRPSVEIAPASDFVNAIRLEATVMPAPTRREPAREVLSFAATSLVPATRYHYRYGTPEAGWLTGQFTTFGEGPYSFSVAFSACAGGTFPFGTGLLSSVSNARVFEAIERLAPTFFLHTGDFHYRNIGPRCAPDCDDDVRRAYDAVLTQPRQASLYRQVPIVYMWDDHDYGPNDSDRTSPSRDEARRNYLAHVPHYPLVGDGAAARGPIQQAFDVGRVRFLVTDTRSERDPWDGRPTPTGLSMLGAAQRDWLLRELERSTDAALVVWVNTVPWITKASERPDRVAGDGWGPYRDERREIANAIARLGLDRRLVMLSGDAHMVAIDDGTNSNYSDDPTTRGFPVVHAAPLDRRTSYKGGDYSHGDSRQNGQFAVMTVDDDGETLAVAFRTYVERDGRATPLPGLTLDVRCVGGECRVGNERK